MRPLVCVNVVHHNQYEELLNLIPKTPPARTIICKSFENINNTGDVNNRNSHTKTQCPYRMCQKSVSNSASTQQCPWGQQLQSTQSTVRNILRLLLHTLTLKIAFLHQVGPQDYAQQRAFSFHYGQHTVRFRFHDLSTGNEEETPNHELHRDK